VAEDNNPTNYPSNAEPKPAQKQEDAHPVRIGTSDLFDDPQKIKWTNERPKIRWK
jgi:hypothetical protein